MWRGHRGLCCALIATAALNGTVRLYAQTSADHDAPRYQFVGLKDGTRILLQRDGLEFVVELAGAFADVPTVSRPQVTHTDRNPIPVSLPERVGDRLVVEPVERSEKAAEILPWVRLAWNLGVFNPLVGLLTPDFSFSGMGFCW